MPPVTRRASVLLSAALLVVLLGLTSGCATMNVKPWDRDLLAQKQMRFIPSRIENSVDEHIYFSKEGSTGGHTATGGGCGCD
jgi:hypothetical protein